MAKMSGKNKASSTKGKKKRGSVKKLSSVQKMRQRLGDQKVTAVLRALADPDLPSRSRSSLVNSMSKKEVHAVREIAYNFLRENIPVKPLEVAKLARYRKTLRGLVERLNLETHKKIIAQRGGFLPLLLPLLLKTAVGTVAALANK
jgi:hypothetical protein